jgi:Subtilase family
LAISHNILLLSFISGTTVQEANTILASAGAVEIVGGIAGVTQQSEGVLIVRLASTTHAAIQTTITSLSTNPKIKVAVEDVLLSDLAVSKPTTGLPASTWTWETPPQAGGNWGLETSRIPQMWNLNAIIKQVGNSSVTGIYDSTINLQHEDLLGVPSQLLGFAGLSTISHGTFVAGIIAAKNNNGLGIDGVNPFTQVIVTEGVAESIGGKKSLGETLITDYFYIVSQAPSIKTLNISKGYNWCFGLGKINFQDVNAAAEANRIANQGGTYFSLVQNALVSLGYNQPLVVTGAGNDSNDSECGTTSLAASIANPFANASIRNLVNNVIVVEAIQQYVLNVSDIRISSFSGVNGSISAPGSNVYSLGYTASDYRSGSGTSYAAPFVTGLISYLFAADPNLSQSQIKSLLLDNGIITTGASRRMDGFASLLAIDALRGNKKFLKALLDVDDGTLDGNQRVLIGTSATTSIGSDGNNDGVDDTAPSANLPLELKNSLDYVFQTGNEYGPIGDGTIDISDFRRWRDWLIQSKNTSLSGSTQHPKKDLNLDGVVKTGSSGANVPEENVYPRGDFNGDGKLSDSATNPFPLSTSTAKTDLDVLVESGLWSDPYYTTSNLSGLLQSGDLEIWIRDFYSLPRAATVESYIEGDLLEDKVIHTPSNPRFVYTLAPGTYTAYIRVLSDDGLVILAIKKLSLLLLGKIKFGVPVLT